jgi:hypothetical protein
VSYQTPVAEILPPTRIGPSLRLRLLADRASRLADLLDDEGRLALGLVARNLAFEIESVANEVHRLHLRRVA